MIVHLNRTQQLLLPLYAVLVIFAVACNASAATITPERTSAPQASGTSTTANGGLTVEQLKNTTYYFKDAPHGQITLQNGTAQEPLVPNAASQYVATFIEPAAFGDLNNNSAADAADIIVTNAGGSGSFYNLAALLNDSGQPKNVAATLLGDRIKINSLKIENGQIQVEYLEHGPQEPMSAAPTQRMVKTYQLVGNQLVEIH